MAIEARSLCALSIFVAPETYNGDLKRLLASRQPAESPRHFVAVHVGHPNIKERDRWQERGHELEGGDAVNHARIMPIDPKQVDASRRRAVSRGPQADDTDLPPGK